MARFPHCSTSQGPLRLPLLKQAVLQVPRADMLQIHRCLRLRGESRDKLLGVQHKQPLLAPSSSSPACGIQGSYVSGTGKPPPCAALLAVACAAPECDGDGARQGMSVIFLPLSSSGIAKAGSPIVGKGRRLPWRKSPAKLLPTKLTPNRTPFYCGAAAERAGRSAP